MRFDDLSAGAILWSCYLEGFSDPARFLGLRGLGDGDRLAFDRLGRFFPFEEYWVRGALPEDGRAIGEPGHSSREMIIPWMYRPRGQADTVAGKPLLCPGAELFALLDDKVWTKELLMRLGLPTPAWGGARLRGKTTLEKPIRNSAGGIGLRFSSAEAREGYFLEEYLPGMKSLGLQFFLCGEVEFLCADEMLYPEGAGDAERFVFHAQRNVPADELPPRLLDDCTVLMEHLLKMGYRGFVGVDLLSDGATHTFLEVNPRGIVFLPAFLAARALGWERFITQTVERAAEPDELVLLDFDTTRKIVRRLPDESGGS